jgi:hypothetical protein
VDEADEIAKKNCAEACHDANDQRESRQMDESYLGNIVVAIHRT